MASQEETKPVGDDVPRVDGTVAVGEDLAFQRRWWKFERLIWIFFILILIADLAGVLGRGPLANAEKHTADGALRMKYERVLRENTPSIVTLLPESSAVHDGKLQVFVSDSVLKQLGAQRVIPQPQTSVVGNGGVTYTFLASSDPMNIQIELRPSFVGTHAFQIGIAGSQLLEAKPFVLP